MMPFWIIGFLPPASSHVKVYDLSCRPFVRMNVFNIFRMAFLILHGDSYKLLVYCIFPLSELKPSLVFLALFLLHKLGYLPILPFLSKYPFFYVDVEPVEEKRGRDP